MSLCLQIILIVFGSKRKRSASFLIRILVWSAYNSADWVAITALGNMARSQGDVNNDFSRPSREIQAFWVPFLLLHLGGPDSITAYSLEDNELWLRHFLALVVQAGVAFYVFVRSWKTTKLTLIAIPMFVTGIVKYLERTCVLRSSSSKHFRSSLLSYPQIKYVLVKEEGTDKEILRREMKEESELTHDKVDPSSNYLCQAYYLFKRSTYLFAELILDYYERVGSYSIIHDKEPTDVFKLIETELGLMYDMLYTKASIVYSFSGILLRIICFCSSISALIAFSVHVDSSEYPSSDIIISYILLAGAVGLEIYAFILLLRSDWTRYWFAKRKKNKSHSISFSQAKKRWSRSIAQHNLITFCYRLYDSGEISDCKCLSWKPVDEYLKALIFQQLLEKGNKISYDQYNLELCKQFLSQRGDYALEQSNRFDEFSGSTTKVEFDHSLLLWHIATYLCYIDDIPENTHRNNIDPSCLISKHLSNYMMYLLVECPFMLPKGIGEIRYRDTCKELKKFLELKFEQRDFYTRVREASNVLLQTEIDKSEDERGDQNKSVLFDGCKLARQLQSLDAEQGWNRQQKWKMISEVWVEMLAYAASHCGWKEHAQQLTNGGELITHVCVLMAHLGLSEQYQLQKQYIKRMEVPSWVRYAVVPPVCCFLACEGIFILVKKMCVGVAGLVCGITHTHPHPSQVED